MVCFYFVFCIFYVIFISARCVFFVSAALLFFVFSILLLFCFCKLGVLFRLLVCLTKIMMGTTLTDNSCIFIIYFFFCVAFRLIFDVQFVLFCFGFVNHIPLLVFWNENTKKTRKDNKTKQNNNKWW